MLLFWPNKEHEVQSFVLKLVNNHCPEMGSLREGPRAETRGNLTLVVLVVPMEKGRPQPDQAFTAVTKEFGTSGVGLVLDSPRPLNDLVLGIRFQGEVKFVRAEAKHLTPMGAGFYQLGLKLKEMLHVGDYPELKKVIF